MQDYVIIDNFLPKNEWQEIYNAILTVNPETANSPFSWLYNEYVAEHKTTTDESTNFQFTHTFCDEDKYLSDSYIIEPIIEKIKPDFVRRIKANLLPKTHKPTESEWHIDQDLQLVGDKYSALYYVNNNNGYTVFKKGTKVKSQANRLLVFKNELEHTGVPQSDTKVRVVINFAFTKKGGCLGVG